MQVQGNLLLQQSPKAGRTPLTSSRRRLPAGGELAPLSFLADLAATLTTGVRSEGCTGVVLDFSMFTMFSEVSSALLAAAGDRVDGLAVMESSPELTDRRAGPCTAGGLPSDLVCVRLARAAIMLSDWAVRAACKHT